ncbi:uncharacterized protein LOC126984470 isoform X3 [Eriocheir sinensis]|nr:uncharacterized protein LOC126984470 isoform X3 [Eriocheir sinensis]
MNGEDDIGYQVELFVYDLSKGLAKSMSPALLGKQIEGIWHTGVVAYGREYFFGSGGIESCRPGGTILGDPERVEELGESQVPYPLFLEYIFGLGEATYKPGAYDLLKHNCNNFSDEVSQFLCGHGIPKHILQLPDEVLNTPLGETLSGLVKELDIKSTGSRKINFGNYTNNNNNNHSLGYPPGAPVPRHDDSPDLELERLNQAIDQVRQNTQRLEDRRNSINEKVQKRDKKKKEKREKKERKEKKKKKKSKSTCEVPEGGGGGGGEEGGGGGGEEEEARREDTHTPSTSSSRPPRPPHPPSTTTPAPPTSPPSTSSTTAPAPPPPGQEGTPQPPPTAPQAPPEVRVTPPAKEEEEEGGEEEEGARGGGEEERKKKEEEKEKKEKPQNQKAVRRKEEEEERKEEEEEEEKKEEEEEEDLPQQPQAMSDHEQTPPPPPQEEEAMEGGQEERGEEEEGVRGPSPPLQAPPPVEEVEREPPIVFKDDVNARESFECLAASCGSLLSGEEKSHLEELRAYVLDDEGSWALGENFSALLGRVLHDGTVPDEARVHLLRLMAAAALKDDVILLLHQDRRDHTIMNYANRVESLGPHHQEALALFFCNMFEHVSPSEWLLYISEWQDGSQPTSNIRVTTKVAVNALLNANPKCQEYGSAIMYNLGTKEVKTVVFDDVAPELAMAILQFFNAHPPEELLWRAMAALCRFTYSSTEVPALIKMIGPEPNTFRGASERVDALIDEIDAKLSRVRLF